MNVYIALFTYVYGKWYKQVVMEITNMHLKDIETGATSKLPQKEEEKEEPEVEEDMDDFKARLKALS